MTKGTDLRDREELEPFLRRSDLAGAGAVLFTWGIIAATFAALACWPHPLVFVAAVIVLGGRQLALAILMHEAAHRTLFRARWLNDVAADWLCARPVGADVARYRTHHLAHHAHAGTERDPDLSLIEPFPTSGASLARKILRDLVGVTGLKRAFGLTIMDAGLIDYTVSGDVRRLPRRSARHHLAALLRHSGPVWLVNLALAAILAATGHAWLYLAWIAAWLTTYGLFLRIRSMAEHACTEGGPDPLRNTRTTHAGLLARLTVAPHQVNYHLEHHLWPTVPCFRLPGLHRRLAAAGQLPAAALAKDYRTVLRIMTSAR